jgi:DNA-directed RNA polymerase subunit alpha
MQNPFIQYPNKIELENETRTRYFGRFTMYPLEKGYGVTLGNALRRVLISSLPGTAITGVRINNIPHEFTTIKDVVEDVSEIILNLKEVRFKPNFKKSGSNIEFRLKGPLEFIARHIQESTEDYEILNPNHHIATLNKNADMVMTIRIGYGIGYVPAEENKLPDQDLLLIPIDSIFTPIKNVKYEVAYTRVGQRTDYEKLIIDVTTDGTVDPVDAMTTAAEILNEHILMFSTFGKEPVETVKPSEEESEFQRIKQILLTNVDELKLSVRAQNCLRSANIKTLADLVKHQEVEMLQFRNFGRKSLAELGEILVEHNLNFGMDVDKYLNEESN